MAFTEKGLEAIKAVISSYKEGDKFCAKDIGVAGATMVSICKDGYLTRYNTSPVSYSYTKEQYDKIVADLPKTFARYSEKELLSQMEMTYMELVNYCNNKYGNVTGSYFCTPEMKSQNSKIRRSKEGLIVHHVMEDRSIMLCNKIYAIEQPWEWQCGENLVYCNIFEHLLLHMKITENLDFLQCLKGGVVPGWGGVVNFILPGLINEYYSVNYVENVSKKFFREFVCKWLEDICKSEKAILFRQLDNPMVLPKWRYPRLWLMSNSEEEFIEAVKKEEDQTREEIRVRESEEKRKRKEEEEEKIRIFKTSKIRHNKTGKIYENYEAVLAKYGRGQLNENNLRNAIENKTKWHKSTWQYID